MSDKGTIVKMSNGMNLISAMNKKIFIVDAGAKSNADKMKPLDVNAKLRDLMIKGIDRKVKKSSAGNLVTIQIKQHFQKMIKTITAKLKDTYIVVDNDVAMAMGSPFVSLSVLDEEKRIYSLESIILVNK